MPIAISPESAMELGSPCGEKGSRDSRRVSRGGQTMAVTCWLGVIVGVSGACALRFTLFTFASGGPSLAEFLAIHQSDASLLGCVLRKLSGKVSLGAQEPAAGVGFFQSEAVLICCGGVATALSNSARPFNEHTTLPLRFKRWLFAAAGEPDTLSPIRSALVDGLPAFLRRSVKGDSAVEALFFTFLSRLRDAGQLDAHDVTAVVAARSLAAAVGAAERAFEQQGSPLPKLALIATNGRV